MLYECDLETTKNADGSMRAWLIDACEIADGFKHTTFDTLDSFMHWAEDEAFYRDIVLYWHNLKFDGSYLVNWLHDNGYKWASKATEPMTYSVLVTERNQWFMGSMVTQDGYTIEFRDSLKKIPLKVSAIAKAYKLPMSKGEIDYKAKRPIGYQATPEEISYIHRDTEIVARAIKIHFDQGMTSLTAPADAMADYKSMVDFDALFTPRWWRTHKSAERFCRDAYCGGISWVNPEIRGKTVRHGRVFDYNSMYPSVMTMYEYPVGYPVHWFDRPPDDMSLWIAKIKVDNLRRKVGAPACIRDPYKHEWIEWDFYGEINITNIDYQLLIDNYDFDTIEIIEGYSFRAKKGIFDCFIDKWRKIKQGSTGPMRQLAKLMLNSFYGKFGSNPRRMRKHPEFDDEGIVHWKCDPAEDGGTVFSVAVAAFVTAYARRELVEGIHNCEGFCYCDTDSVHCASIDGKAAKFTGKTHPTEFGFWKEESRFVRARFLRQKTYIEEEPSGHLNIAACGCPESSKKYITFDNFEIGASFKGKLMPKMRKGGVELIEKRFTIHAPIFSF